MWADNETSEDLLGFKVHADLLVNIINDDSILPITIGIFGDWGSGKSSILQILKEEFEKEDSRDTLCIYFNGWTFEGYDDAKAALLKSIIKEVEDNKNIADEIKETIKEKSRKLWKSIDWMRGAGMIMKNIALPAISAYFSGGISLVPFVIQKLKDLGTSPEEIVKNLQTEEGQSLLKLLIKEKEAENINSIDTISNFRKDFSDLLDTTNFKKLVVIIDDLDRCSPERIIENLEAIKLFLNVPKTAFIIGADERIVKHAIEYKYNKNNVEKDRGRIVIDYLEKLIQLPYSLPKLSESEVETYISMLICKKEIDSSQFIKVIEEFQKYRSSNRYSAFGLSNFEKILESDDYEKIKSNIITIPALVPLITNSLYGNPRQIKRFLNIYTIRQRLAQVASLQTFNSSILAKMMILEYSEPKLFRQLFDWQSIQDGVPKEISEMEKICEAKNIDDCISELKNTNFKEWSNPKIIKWLQVEPLLSDVDLRDYYWITRDTLHNSISATSMIPPIVKVLFEKLLIENMTSSVTEDIISEEFSTFTGIEKEAFFYLLSSNLKRNPKQKRFYDIFNMMVEKNIENVIHHYMEALRIISLKDIEPGVAMRLADFISIPDIGTFLREYFDKDTASSASKAFNRKIKKLNNGNI